jgi:hypothetical protein
MCGEMGYRGCRYGCHTAPDGPRHGHQIGYFPPLISVEDEVKALEKFKEVLEKRLDTVNKRLEQLKK